MALAHLHAHLSSHASSWIALYRGTSRTEILDCSGQLLGSPLMSKASELHDQALLTAAVAAEVLNLESFTSGIDRLRRRFPADRLGRRTQVFPRTHHARTDEVVDG